MTVNADFYRQLGRRIAGLRKVLGLSQERLGERARVGASYVAHIETGSRKPTLDVLLRIAEAVNAPLWRLLTDDRLTPDEKARDAATRDLNEKAHGLAQPDLYALAYLASRLKTAPSATTTRHGQLAIVPELGAPRSRAAEGSPSPDWQPPQQPARRKRSRRR